MRERKPFKLGLDPSAYNPIGMKAYTEDEIRREYARLRREAEQRLTRLGKSEFRDSAAYRQNVGKFKRLDQIHDRRTLERLTQEAAKFVTARGSSASGQRGIRRDIIDTLHSSGYKFVNTKNFKKFTEFMDTVKAMGLDKIFYELKGESDEDLDEEPLNADVVEELFTEYLESGEIDIEKWADALWLTDG